MGNDYNSGCTDNGPEDMKLEQKDDKEVLPNPRQAIE